MIQKFFFSMIYKGCILCRWKSWMAAGEKMRIKDLGEKMKREKEKYIPLMKCVQH